MATALLLVTTDVIGKQQAIDPSSILPHFFDCIELGYFYVIEFFPSLVENIPFKLNFLSLSACEDINAANLIKIFHLVWFFCLVPLYFIRKMLVNFLDSISVFCRHSTVGEYKKISRKICTIFLREQ